MSPSRRWLARSSRPICATPGKHMGEILISVDIASKRINSRRCTDTAAVQAQDIAYALGSLRTRIYDPVGNLRAADNQTTYGPAMLLDRAPYPLNAR